MIKVFKNFKELPYEFLFNGVFCIDQAIIYIKNCQYHKKDGPPIERKDGTTSNGKSRNPNQVSETP